MNSQPRPTAVLDGDLTVFDEFAGAGGSSQGAAAVPGVVPVIAVNHCKPATETYAANFPNADVRLSDVRKLDLTVFPRADIFVASPACPEWTNSSGKRRVFDKTNQYSLFSDGSVVDGGERSRALMEEVPRYLEAVAAREKPVLAGMVENVVQCRLWDDWNRWLNAIRSAGDGYETRVIAFNSMHAIGENTRRAPQVRDRLFVAYWQRGLKEPDWNKWLRPRAYCEGCDNWVDAIQVFKDPRADMGKYGSQYTYRCPQVACRGREVFPDTLPAAAAIDWSNPGVRIGDLPKRPSSAILARIEAGIRKYGGPIHLAVAGQTFERRPGVRSWPITDPFKTQSTSEQFAIAIPPHLMPFQEIAADWVRQNMGRRRRNEQTYPVSEADPFALPLFVSESDRSALARMAATTEPYDFDIEDVYYRRLELPEIGRTMAFAEDYIVCGERSEVARQYGNAVTPPVAELIVSALVESITGRELDRNYASADPCSIGLGA